MRFLKRGDEYSTWLRFYLTSPSLPFIRFSNPEEFADSGNFDTFYACSLFWLLPMSRPRPWNLGFGLFSVGSLYSVVGFPLLSPGMSYCVFIYLNALHLHSACWRPIHVLRPSVSATSPRICVSGFFPLTGFWVWREEGGHWSQADRPHLPPRAGCLDELTAWTGKDSTAVTLSCARALLQWSLGSRGLAVPYQSVS